MFKTLRRWFVNAIANGGVVLVLAGVLLAGAIGEIGQPVHTIETLLWDQPGVAHEPSAAVVGLNEYKCPDATWVRNAGQNADVGSPFVTCTKNKVVIRHFERVPNGVQQDQAMDQGVYPFNDKITIADAIRIANSR